MRKLIVLALVAFGLFIVPAANAGCLAVAGSSFYDPAGAIGSHHGISCTSNNGAHYEVRTYLQADNGGWHTTTPLIKYDVYNPVNGFSKNYVSYWQCNSTWMPPTAHYVRSKTVVQRDDGVNNVAYGPALAIPSNC